MHRVAEIEGDQRFLGEAILVDGHRGLRVTMACPNCVSEPVRTADMSLVVRNEDARIPISLAEH